MRAAKTGEMRAGINVTPLVDVVLVLLIIFMIIAPQLGSDTAVELPETDRPPDKPEDGRQIVVVIPADGPMTIDGDPVTRELFSQRIGEAADGRADFQVVIKGDARLTFGRVQEAMFMVESAGFGDVGLITERHEPAEQEG